MSSIARLETTYAYNKQKVVIDVADLMNAEGYYEAIAMSPDGRIEYEVMHTKDRQEALDAFELYKLRAQGGYPEGVYTKEQWHKDGSFKAHADGRVLYLRHFTGGCGGTGCQRSVDRA